MTNKILKLHSGSTLLNMACSGDPDYAMLSGGYYWIVGDSSSGKTFLARTFLAEASINPLFDKYDLIYDDVEGGAKMDDTKFFGKKMASRLQSPIVDNPDGRSRTVEEFYFNIDTRIKAAKKRGGRPFVYILDSMDSLDTDYAEEKFAEAKKAWEKDTDAKGDYGDGKAGFNSRRLRSVCADVEDLNSILVILSQTRDNPAAKMFQSKSTVAGGRSLKFYCQWQLWTSIAETLTKRVNGAERQVGIKVQVLVKKNRLSGKQWPITLPLYWSFGIEDTESCIDYLLQEKRFPTDKDKEIVAPELDFCGRRAELIDHVIRNNLQSKIKDIVAEVWRDIEKKCSVEYPNKYT